MSGRRLFQNCARPRKARASLEQFDKRRKELAHQTIDVIGNAPKAVSQANAEELLAKRVYTDPGHFLISEVWAGYHGLGQSFSNVLFNDFTSVQGNGHHCAPVIQNTRKRNRVTLLETNGVCSLFVIESDQEVRGKCIGIHFYLKT